MGKLTAAVGNSGNLAQVLQVNGTQLASLAGPQSAALAARFRAGLPVRDTGGLPRRVDVLRLGLFHRPDRLYARDPGSFLGDAYFDNQLIDEQLRQLVGDGLGAGSFIPGNNATDRMKTLLDRWCGLPRPAALLSARRLPPSKRRRSPQSIVIYQTGTVDGAQVLVPVVYLSAADRAKTTALRPPSPATRSA